MTSSLPRVLTIIPAHNEVANLPAVVGELRHCRPDLQILVIDDGSTDGTIDLLPRLDVRWLSWPVRQGVGSAVRAGLRYADEMGFDAVVRLDADGQHDVTDIERLLEPLRAATADVVIGSRYMNPEAGGEKPGSLRLTLAAVLSMLTRHRVTDATSGFWALGARAVSLLAEHHPSGYAEPELHLLVSRSPLRTIEVPVRARPRLSGRSSLTPVRLAAAAARVLLAVVVVPFRGPVSETRD